MLRRKPRRGFLRDEAGVTAVEFGLLALPFFSILGAILETSVLFLSGQMLDTAVYDVSRLIRTGQAQEANMTAARFKTLLCDRLLELYPNCRVGDNMHVEVQVLGTFNDSNISPPVNFTCTAGSPGCDQWTRPESYSPGQGSSIVVVQVYYRWPVLLNFGGLGQGTLPDGRRLVGASTVFRNEPFT